MNTEKIEKQEDAQAFKTKTIWYYISFGIIAVLSALQALFMAKSTIGYLTSGENTQIVAIICALIAMVLAFVFLALLTMHFFTKDESLSANVIKMLIIGIGTNILAFFANFSAQTMIFSKSTFFLGTGVALLYLIHLFFVPEFKTVVPDLNDRINVSDNEDDYFDETDNEEYGETEENEQTDEEDSKETSEKHHKPKHFVDSIDDEDEKSENNVDSDSDNEENIAKEETNNVDNTDEIDDEDDEYL